MSARLIIATHVLNGRRVGRIANLKTLDGDATIKEAVTNGYVVGKPEVVRSQTCGVLKAMLAGLQRDGGSEGSEEIQSTRPVRVVIEA